MPLNFWTQLQKKQQNSWGFQKRRLNNKFWKQLLLRMVLIRMENFWVLQQPFVQGTANWSQSQHPLPAAPFTNLCQFIRLAFHIKDPESPFHLIYLSWGLAHLIVKTLSQTAWVNVQTATNATGSEQLMGNATIWMVISMDPRPVPVTGAQETKLLGGLLTTTIKVRIV